MVEARDAQQARSSAERLAEALALEPARAPERRVAASARVYRGATNAPTPRGYHHFGGINTLSTR